MEVGSNVGEGSVRSVYPHVRLATHPNGHRAACKILPALHRPRQGPIDWDETVDAVEAHKEVVLLKALAGAGLQGIVGLEGVIEQDGWTFIFLTLYERSASRITEQKPANVHLIILFFRRLCQIIHSLHQLGISHEDLKRSNLLLDGKNRPILVDFGFSHFFPDGGMVKSAGGTLDYSSPEKVQDHEYDPKANDVWALGILLGKLFDLPHPFATSTGQSSRLKEKICFEEPNFHGLEVLPEGRLLGNLLKGMLHKDPAKRLTISQILCHPFLSVSNPAPRLFTPLPERLPEDFPSVIPTSVLEDVCFLSYVIGSFFLCQSPRVVKAKILGPGECWEKRWAGMLSKWKQKDELFWEDVAEDDAKASKKISLAPPRPLQEIHLSPNIHQPTNIRDQNKGVKPPPNSPIKEQRRDKENTFQLTRKTLIGQMRGKAAPSPDTTLSTINVDYMHGPPPIPRRHRMLATPARIDFPKKKVTATRQKHQIAKDPLADLTKLIEPRETRSLPRYITKAANDKVEEDIEMEYTSGRVKRNIVHKVGLSKEKRGGPKKEVQEPVAARRSQRLMARRG